MIGMTIFSALSLEWARQELVATQKRQQEESKAVAEDLAKAMEFAVMTETFETYNETYALDRARAYSNSTGTTRGGNQVALVSRNVESDDGTGAPRTQVALAATDDILLRAKLNRAEDAESLNRAVSGTAPVAFFDSGTVRGQQLLTSQRRMEAIAEKLFTFYAAEMKFPSPQAFAALSKQAGVKDAWGQDFTFTPSEDGQSGELSFTTPWGLTRTQSVSLRDEVKSAE
jgi:hypothetical protein